MDDHKSIKKSWTSPALESLEMERTAQQKFTPGIEAEVQGGADVAS